MCEKDNLDFFESRKKAIAKCEKFFESRDMVAFNVVSNSIRPVPSHEQGRIEPLFVMSKKHGEFVIEEINGARGVTIVPEIAKLR